MKNERRKRAEKVEYKNKKSRKSEMKEEIMVGIKEGNTKGKIR